MRCLTALAVVAVCAAAPLPNSRAGAAAIDFDRQIAPLLAARCLGCHSGGEPKGGLDLSRAAGLRAGGESGEPLVGKSLAESHLWKLIASGEMPPKNRLPAAEQALLQAWLSAGAPWGAGPIDPLRYTTPSRAGYDWWSLQPLHAHAPPSGSSPRAAASEVREPLDDFLLAPLTASGLEPNPPAPPQHWYRRLKFDLLGLPPEPEETAAFLADRAPDARERAVDRLLASPQYGERWARHWLDVAHFGESDGFEYDRMRPTAWRYRDWVISALNRDLPYDEFARLQIAGDVLPAGASPTAAEAGLIATGFLVAGAHDSLQPKGEIMRAIMRQDELEDLVGLVGQSFLGLSVQCARCHDHKFDPISQRDYFRLAAALAGVRRGERSLPAETVARGAEARLAAVQQELSALDAAAQARVLAQSKEPARPAPPQPLAAWEFEGNARDAVGELHGALRGGAKLAGGALVLDGKDSYFLTPPLKTALGAKTLAAWVRLESLDQRGGGVLSVQTLDGRLFDALVFGERDPRQWLAGSNNFARTQSFSGSPEAEAAKQFVQLTLVYAADGQITAYRNGAPYGKSYAAGKPQPFAAGESQVVIGLRHSPPGGNRLLAGRIERAQLYDRALAPEEVAALAGAAFVTAAERLAALSPAERARREALVEESAALAHSLHRTAERKTFAVTPQPPGETFVLLRGDPQKKGEPAPPGSLSAASPVSARFALPLVASDAERRTALAAWIAAPGNPLFARTLVNRVWHYRFGRGLVETPSDLGFSGGRPSHPELLDRLASDFVRRDFSLKQLHRRLLSSAAFARSSSPQAAAQAQDADNRLLWRYPPRRLEAETLRDFVLAVAGELNPQQGGVSFQDFRPYFYKGSQFYEPQDPVGPEFHRRSIYRMWARGGRNPLLDTFDCPDPSAATPRRGVTTTPLQALSLLNSSLMLRMSDSLAQRLAREAPAPAARVARAWELCYGRSPSPDEQAAALTFAQEVGWPALARVLLNSNGFLYVD